MLLVELESLDAAGFEVDLTGFDADDIAELMVAGEDAAEAPQAEATDDAPIPAPPSRVKKRLTDAIEVSAPATPRQVPGEVFRLDIGCLDHCLPFFLVVQESTAVASFAA